MRLMIIVNNPARAGFRLRISDHSDYLGRQGIRCDVYKLPRKLVERWNLFKKTKGFDAVMIHKKCLNFWDLAVLSFYCPKTIFDFDDAIMYSPFRPESNITSHYRLFRRMAKKMDIMIAGNEYLADHARRYCSRVYVLPTGLDTSAYHLRKLPSSNGKIRLVWIGSESTLQYLEELRPVFEQIGKKFDHVVLRIIADRFFDLDHMAVEKHLWTLETQASDLAACDIGLSPIPDNRFTRGKCGFKILQYFAAGLPVIASPVGINEKFIRESHAGIPASGSHQWCEAIATVVKNIDSYRQAGKNGQKYVLAYDRSVISENLCHIIKSSQFQDNISS